MKLLIAIPALNEEQSIESIIQRSLAARETIIGNSCVDDLEITVVSDGSTDATVERAMKFADQIRVIVFPKNRGYGAAIMEAWNQSDAELLSFLDADGTCDPLFFADLCRKLEVDRADVVLGCRLNAGSRMPLIRRLGNMVFAALLTTLSRKTVRDTASGMRVVRRSALRNLYPLPNGLHFTPAMSARAMLSDRVGIAEIDMPYAEREGRSKLSVLRDGLRFLSVILGTALLYRPGKLLIAASAVAMVATAALLAYPSWFYLQNRRLEEWMIYRFLVSGLFAQVGLLLWGASALSSRAVEVAVQEEIRQTGNPLYDWIRTPALWAIVALTVFFGLFLVWPSAVQLWQTGHTDVHWSRFVVAMGAFGGAASLAIIHVLDRLLSLVSARVRYLAGATDAP